jgi:hypothetical protein
MTRVFAGHFPAERDAAILVASPAGSKKEQSKLDGQDLG